MRCGWKESEIKKELRRRLDESQSDEEKKLLLSIAQEAKDIGSSWPLRPKPVPKPRLTIEAR
jgi:hypothetical protein